MLSAESHYCRRGGHPLVWGSKEAEKQDRYDHNILIPLLCCVAKFPFVSLETRASSRHLPFLCTVPISSESFGVPPGMLWESSSLPPGSHTWLGPSQKFPQFSSVQFSRSVVSNSLHPHGLQHARLPCPSPTPGTYSNSCPNSKGFGRDKGFKMANHEQWCKMLEENLHCVLVEYKSQGFALTE